MIPARGRGCCPFNLNADVESLRKFDGGNPIPKQINDSYIGGIQIWLGLFEQPVGCG
jgi:hypothetical protein